MNKFVNEIALGTVPTQHATVSPHVRPDIGEGTVLFENLVTTEENEYINNKLNAVEWMPVSITGMKGNYREGDRIGSWRASAFTQEYADVLWERINLFLPKIEVFHSHYPTDFDKSSQWEPIGVAALLRFIKYTDGGCLVPHYDAPYIENDNQRTLKSLVIYLDQDANLQGGATRYLDDPQAHLPVEQRDLSDRLTLSDGSDVRVKVHPQRGSGILFPHRIWHDSEPVTGSGVKTIIRTDVVYRRVN